MNKDQERKIKDKIRKFIINMHRYENLDESDFTINPFLASALKLNKRKDIIKFFLLQRLQRGIVTSFGTLLQEIAKILDSKANIEDIDLVINKGKKRYYIQLKSGPEGFTRPALRKTKQAFKKLKEKYSNIVTTIAFCYGEKDKLSPIWGKEVYNTADKVLVGREFWDYFFRKGFYDELINIFKNIKVKKKKGVSFKRKSFNEILKVVYKRILNS